MCATLLYLPFSTYLLPLSLSHFSLLKKKHLFSYCEIKQTIIKEHFGSDRNMESKKYPFLLFRNDYS